MIHFYRKELDDLILEFETDRIRGLTQKEASKRLKKFGTNSLPTRPPERFLWVFFKQLNNAFSYLLIAAAILKYLVEGYRDAIIIGIVIIVNALVSAIQEGRASQTIAMLRSFLKTDCLVVRDGNMVLVDQTVLVPGDILILHEGMRIPADARLFEGHELRVDEAILTGESFPVIKSAENIPISNLPVSEQTNMVFTGTTILSGHAHAIVVATGTHAYIGQLTKEVQTIESDMPLKRDLARLSQFLLRAVLCIIAIFMGIGIFYGKDFGELIFTMTSLLVSIVPEGIPIVSTILMTRNAYRMAKSSVLVKRLQAIDGLGRMQVLVIDKTGTLTKNEQVVSHIVIGNNQYKVTGNGYEQTGSVFDANHNRIETAPTGTDLWYLGLSIALLDDAELIHNEKTGTIQIRGEPIQAALGICAQKIGFDKESVQRKYKKLSEVPFSPERPIQKSIFQLDEKRYLVVIMGAPERVEKYANLSDEETPNAMLKELLNEGLRIIAVGYSIVEAEKIDTEVLTLQAIGLFGLHDAIRTDAVAGMRAVQELGVRVLVATGDHLQTAIHTARATGIYRGPQSVRTGTVHGKDLAEVTVLARVTPQDKLRIIGQLKHDGLLVGMTGDGVNDVPALLAADVGIAMGKSGTAVAKDAASIVLLNDSLVSIADGIMLGRHAFSTMRLVLIFALATSASEIITFAISLILNAPLPLLATQILWVHMLTDGLLTVALGMEPMDKESAKKPLDRNARLIDRRMARAFLLTSIPAATVTLGLFMLYIPYGIDQARTIALTALAMGQWWNAWNLRSETASIFTKNPIANRWLFIGTMLAVVAQIMAIYTPFLQKILYTVPLSVRSVIICLCASSLVLLMEEIRKWVVRQKNWVRSK